MQHAEGQVVAHAAGGQLAAQLQLRGILGAALVLAAEVVVVEAAVAAVAVEVAFGAAAESERDAVVADLDCEIREAWGETVIAFT